MHAGGLARAIVKQGGRSIQRASDVYTRRYGDVATGSCCITESGVLPCKKVIHAVGPMWYHYSDKAKARKMLRKTIRSVYITAIKQKMTSLSIPPISGGIFGYPTELCA
jgi:O-acetyl-ADP-ribose deacetylase (regulator of RNase III)